MSGTMLAVRVADEPEAVEVTIPKRQPGTALVRIERAGICGTDISLFKGYSTFRGTVGHEFAGVVEDAETKEWMGKRVTSSINIPPDGSTYDWKQAKHVPNRRALGIRGYDGVMAEYAVIPEYLLHELPENLSFAQGAMAEPLAAAIHAVDSLPEDEGEVLLLGDGRLAQLAAKVMIKRNIPFAVIGRCAPKMELLRDQGGRIIRPLDVALHEKFHRIIEATGSKDGIMTAMHMIAPSGTIVMKSTIQTQVTFDLSNLIVNEIKLIGSRCGSIKEALSLLADGSIAVDDLITYVFPLQQADKAFKATRLSDAIKIQISPHGN